MIKLTVSNLVSIVLALIFCVGAVLWKDVVLFLLAFFTISLILPENLRKVPKLVSIVFAFVFCILAVAWKSVVVFAFSMFFLARILPKAVVITALSLFCLGSSLLLMPWAELGFTAQFPPWLQGFVNSIGLPAIFEYLSPLANSFNNALKKAGAEANFGDYAYVVIMAVAMIAAAVAIVLIGKEEAEEKTILPQKK